LLLKVMQYNNSKGIETPTVVYFVVKSDAPKKTSHEREFQDKYDARI